MIFYRVDLLKMEEKMKNLKQSFQEFFRYRFLLSELVKKGIVLKYRRSYLGIIWTMLEPLLNMIVLTFVFGTLFGNTDKTYPIYILSGRILYTCFSQATKAALRSIRANSGMINKVYVPKYLYPLSGVLYTYVIFGFSLIVLIGTALVLGVWPTYKILYIGLPLFLLLLFSLGVGMILATMGVYFRDMEYLWDVALTLVMYMCAIFYYPDRFINAGLGWILDLNPLYCIIALFRNCIFGTTIKMWHIVYSFGFSVVALVIGIVVFRKKEDEFILHI